MDLTNLQGVCITQAYDVAFLQCFRRTDDEFMCDGIVSVICVGHAVVTHEIGFEKECSSNRSATAAASNLEAIDFQNATNSMNFLLAKLQ